MAIATVMDIYAKKCEPRAATGTTFSMYCILKNKPQYSEGTNPRVTFSEASLFINTVDKLSEAMSKLTDGEKRS